MNIGMVESGSGTLNFLRETLTIMDIPHELALCSSKGVRADFWASSTDFFDLMDEG
jgi:hypothetical protein